MYLKKEKTGRKHLQSSRPQPSHLRGEPIIFQQEALFYPHWSPSLFITTLAYRGRLHARARIATGNPLFFQKNDSHPELERRLWAQLPLCSSRAASKRGGFSTFLRNFLQSLVNLSFRSKTCRKEKQKCFPWAKYVRVGVITEAGQSAPSIVSAFYQFRLSLTEMSVAHGELFWLPKYAIRPGFSVKVRLLFLAGNQERRKSLRWSSFDCKKQTVFYFFVNTSQTTEPIHAWAGDRYLSYGILLCRR